MMLRIVVMNPKGGCGKTTLSTNLASYFSRQGEITTLMDLDPQGSSVFWAHKRPENAAEIQLVDAHHCPHNVTRSWAIQPPRNTEVLVLDTPARPDLIYLNPLLKEASAILLPVLPNEFDLHAIAHTVQQIQRSLPKQQNIALVFNRSSKTTQLIKKIDQLSEQLGLPVIATLRDTRNYIQAAAHGLGISEMNGAHYRRDKIDIAQIAQWCERRRPDEGSTAFGHINPDTIALASNA
jgi:chromosome partitioning protein